MLQESVLIFRHTYIDCPIVFNINYSLHTVEKCVFEQDSQLTYNVILMCVHVITIAVGKQLELQILSVSLVLSIQHAMRIRYVILSSVACPTLNI